MMLKMLTPILFLLFVTSSIGQKKCEISINKEKDKIADLKEPQPLILNDRYEFVYPDEEGKLKFSFGESIILACASKGKEKNRFKKILRSLNEITAVCLDKLKFTVDKKTYNFDSFVCENRQKSSMKPKGPCLRDSSNYEVGFDLEKKFIPVYEICRDRDNRKTHYVKEVISAIVGGHQLKYQVSGWPVDDLFEEIRADQYAILNQRNILNKLLKSESNKFNGWLEEKYINKFVKNNYLDKGHLAPRANFIYGTQQLATFTYANSAPQWASFNRQNWKYVEKAVRNYVQNNKLEVEVYTGVHGQMSLKDTNDVQVPIYLKIGDTNRQNKLKQTNPNANTEDIPVPQYFWKIIYDPVKQSAIALIGVNNPFITKYERSDHLCPDISDEPTFDWWTSTLKHMKDFQRGYLYICDYEELKAKVPAVPKLNVLPKNKQG